MQGDWKSNAENNVAQKHASGKHHEQPPIYDPGRHARYVHYELFIEPYASTGKVEQSIKITVGESQLDGLRRVVSRRVASR